MVKSGSIFISHKNIEASNLAGDILNRELRDQGYHVFFDKSNLKSGMEWEKEILEALQSADVLIVLIEPETAESHWVQREVDMSRGAQVSILPVLVNTTFGEVAAAMDRLNMNQTQCAHFDQAELRPITEQLPRLIQKTYEKKKSDYKQWKERTTEAPNAERNSHAETFYLQGLRDVNFHIATGDATELSGYEVLVNSENTYMQMARYYEQNTLSCQIRLKGALRKGGRIVEDTMQEFLFDQVRYNPDFGRLPVEKRQVIITPVGHGESYLMTNEALNYRYILHAAAVEMDDVKYTIKSLSPTVNGQLIENCYNCVIRIDKQQGEIFYERDGNVYALETNYTPLKSILFPVFGAGQGGNEFTDAVREIAKALGTQTKRALNKGMQITDVGLAIYDKNKLNATIEIFKDAGFQQA